ncbi:sulfur carrier protein ThiS [Vallicoccus soli]|uniref:Sulfur carrier protein ThiS n=1 Tax=Vallicoccus soli TaxID=2339232 RepID=A0A3A3Z326_9ACTN|nr:sulfur carrier protein ThiS [Vallicoccus soli]RJK97812.1 sulfur carrier protein ThiS [Vallicoccus soli]
MSVLVNGAPRDVPPGATVADVVAALTTAPTGVAVARNDEVVPRGAWATTAVSDGDRLEVLTAVQGG